jgi:hypothetical protein
MLAKAKNGHDNIWAFVKLNLIAEKNMQKGDDITSFDRTII